MPNIAYHTSTHGADVCQGMFHLLTRGGLGAHVTQTTAMAMLIAAGCHDMGHVGRNNKFLCDISHDLAVRYNDKSPLENLHAASAVQLLHREDSKFVRDAAQLKEVRRIVVDVILATDMAYHAEHLNKLDAHLETGPIDMAKDVDQGLALRLLLHTIDCGNPGRPWDTYATWTERVLEEFYEQGDDERSRGMPITKAFDRDNQVPKAQFQLGFIGYIVKPLFEKAQLMKCVDLAEPLRMVNENETRWKVAAEEERKVAAERAAAEEAAAAS